MTRGTLLSLVNVSLVAGLAMAVSDAVGQTATVGPTLVTTTCGQGQLTVCGTEPVGQLCSYEFGFTGGKGAFGFNFGGWECTAGGTQNRYKDFDSSKSSGVCVVIRYPVPDATAVSKDDEGDDTASSGLAGVDGPPSFVRTEECSDGEY
ncbi:MAG: hypothetical protein V4617_16715 [Gemmatimonadota bacterium]